ncbi:Hypothetical protein LUCI_5177 [Lucifera butyrica]|uniref:Uncharacterized protein n=1 Tax=Lucifera butyrica TaxID=1351585 RepID=A0A498REY1_9FIRM|nr:hypothetical protein [Lucifera butyrica]VBB09879.1 Hypothetical protein LUCI_5177 [Lucifera butyrica]
MKRTLLMLVAGIVVFLYTDYAMAAANPDQWQGWKTAYTGNCRKVADNLTASKEVFEKLDTGELDRVTAGKRMQELDRDLEELQNALYRLPAVDSLSVAVQDEVRLAVTESVQVINYRRIANHESQQMITGDKDSQHYNAARLALQESNTRIDLANTALENGQNYLTK